MRYVTGTALVFVLNSLIAISSRSIQLVDRERSKAMDLKTLWKCLVIMFVIYVLTCMAISLMGCSAIAGEVIKRPGANGSVWWDIYDYDKDGNYGYRGSFYERNDAAPQSPREGGFGVEDSWGNKLEDKWHKRRPKEERRQDSDTQ